MRRILLFIFLFFASLSATFSQGWHSTWALHFRDVMYARALSDSSFFGMGGHDANDSLTTVFFSHDGGYSWEVINDPIKLSARIIKDGFFSDANNGWAAGYAGLLWKTSDGGHNWSQINLNGVANVRHYNGIDFGMSGVAVGGNLSSMNSIQTIIRSSDAGSTWNIIRDTLGPTLQDVDFAPINTNTGLVVGDSGTILRTTDGGASWMKIPPPTGTQSRVFKAVYFTPDPYFAFIAGGYPHNDSIMTVLMSSNAGMTWHIVIDSIAPMLNGLYFRSSLAGYAVGNHGTFITTNDGGNSWQDGGIDSTLHEYFDLETVHFAGANLGIIGGYWGKILIKTSVPPLGIDEGKGLDPDVWTLYPNPVFNAVSVRFSGNNPEQEIVLRIFASDGRLLKTMHAIGKDQMNIPTEELPSGLYHLQAERGQERGSKSFVKF